MKGKEIEEKKDERTKQEENPAGRVSSLRPNRNLRRRDLSVPSLPKPPPPMKKDER
jgi:hypothetical protein